MRENKFIFFTATIKNWLNLLERDKYKDIIINSLKYLIEKNKIYLYAFVIMPNHIHLIWNIREPYIIENVQRDFLKYTSQMIKYDLVENYPDELRNFESNRKDRKYQFWQDRSYSNILHNRKVIEQKINYIHNNPFTKGWKLVDEPYEYKYSSAKFYFGDLYKWDFLTNFTEHS